MRLLFLILLLANVALYGYIRYAESRVGADAQLALLQISPEKLKLLRRDTPPAPRSDRPTAGQAAPVCLEWGSFAAEDVPRAAAALARFGLGDKLSQRDGGAASNTFVIRDSGDAIAAKIAALKAEFPAATLRATACPELPKVTKGP